MQSMLNLLATHGVPLCLSGITNPLALSMEIADHDLRRKAMKKQRSLATHIMHAIQEKAHFQEIMSHQDDVMLHDLFLTLLDLTPKAA